MGWLSNEIERKDLQDGDHIYTWRRGSSSSHHGLLRRGSSYSHHGIYVGDGKVIHLTRGPGSNNGFSSSPSHPSEGPVLCCTLDEFLSGGDLHRFEYGVSSLSLLTERSGTCTRVCSDPPERVLYRANFLLTDGFGDYDLFKNNCEDFAFYCKTELLDHHGSRRTSTSSQIAFYDALITTFLAYIIMPFGCFPTSFIGKLLMLLFLYCNSRLHFDARSGIGNPLEKVPVERFNQLTDSTQLLEIDTEWIPMLAMLALIFWYWTPGSIFHVCIRTLVLFHLLYLLLADYLGNHSFKIFAHIFKNICVLMVWYWTPEITLLKDIRTLLVDIFAHWLVMEGLINRRSESWAVMLILDTSVLYKCWYWTPESTIIQWLRLFRLNDCFSVLVANLRNHHRKPSEYIFNFISACIVWYWTPETTTLQWLGLLLLYGLYTSCLSLIQIFSGS